MTLAQRLEIYAIAFLAAIVLTVGAFFVGEFKGKYEQQASAAKALGEANSKAIDTYAATLKDRADADAKATEVAQALIAAYDQGITNAHEKIAKLQPTAVKGTDGCPVLTDTARVRWNFVELLPAGSTDKPAAGRSDVAVPAAAVLPAQ